MGEVREYVEVRYRLRKHRLGYNAYDLAPARRRLMKMSQLPEFQFKVREGGHQILGISRITKEEFEEKRKEIRLKKLMKEVTEKAMEKENSYVKAGSITMG